MNPMSQLRKIRILPVLITSAFVALAALPALPAGPDTLTCPYGMPSTCGLTITGLTTEDGTIVPANFPEIMSNAKVDDWKARINIDAFDLYIVEVTIQPGGYLGWHSHPGLSFVVVKSGTATFYEADDCAPLVIPTGGVFFESANDVHMVRNEDPTVPLVNIVIQLVPPGAPRACGEPDPGCFQLTCPYASAW